MAVYDLEEQEQLDLLKSWWSRHRGSILLIIVAAAIAMSAVVAWRYYQNNQASQAAQLYTQLQAAVASKDLKKVRDIASLLREQYPRVGYAVLAGLIGAQAAFESGEVEHAKSALQWIIDRGESETANVARLRLAAILLHEKKYDDALKLLANAPESLVSLYADLKGDILVEQGKLSEARGAYQLALDKSHPRSPLRGLIEIKRDALGEAK